MSYGEVGVTHLLDSTFEFNCCEGDLDKVPNDTAENTGRWTKEEHQMFLKGLKSHGKIWKKIAIMIPTRTVIQIRTHAQKYFQKVERCNSFDDVAMKTVDDSVVSKANVRGNKVFIGSLFFADIM